MTHGSERRRGADEYFGLERLLWEDRRDGSVCRGFLEQLARAERELGADLGERGAALAPAEADRHRALLEAVRAARAVLSAARDAVRERDVPVFAPRA